MGFHLPRLSHSRLDKTGHSQSWAPAAVTGAQQGPLGAWGVGPALSLRDDYAIPGPPALGWKPWLTTCLGPMSTAAHGGAGAAEPGASLSTLQDDVPSPQPLDLHYFRGPAGSPADCPCQARGWWGFGTKDARKHHTLHHAHPFYFLFL